MNKRRIFEQKGANPRQTKSTLEYLLGKTMNVYSSSPNTNQNFLDTYRIVGAKPLGTIGTKGVLSVTDRSGHSVGDLIKTCGKKAFENANSVGGKNKFLYSDKLNDMIESNFCSRSKGGSVVPSADFASTGAGSGEAIAEGRRVVRLSESDLVRIVKRVIEEQTPPYFPDGADIPRPGRPKEVEECLMEVLSIDNVMKFKNCLSLGTKILKKQMPTQEEIMSSLKEIRASGKDGCKILPAFVQCIATKSRQKVDNNFLTLLESICGAAFELLDMIPKF